MPNAIERSRLVPGSPVWRVRRVRRDGRTVSIRARHRLVPWRTIAVETRDLRYGAEAIARHLEGAPVGFEIRESQTWQTWRAWYEDRRYREPTREPVAADWTRMRWTDPDPVIKASDDLFLAWGD